MPLAAPEHRLLAARLFSGPLSPVIKAYILGYLASTIPRLPRLLYALSAKNVELVGKVTYIKLTLSRGLGLNRFPMACAWIVAGATVIPRAIEAIIQNKLSLGSRLKHLTKSIRIVSCFVCAWLAFGRLNSSSAWAQRYVVSNAQLHSLQNPLASPAERSPPEPMLLAGKTLDLTSFAFCRAVDVLILRSWFEISPLWHHNTMSSQIAGVVQRLADPTVFAGSTAIIMWSWFYAAERLPRTYNKWIAEFADIDHALIQALRLCREGEFVYGVDTGQQDLLLPICQRFNFPDTWANPILTVPIPCELYHCGRGKSCEIHALKRFFRSFSTALKFYIPLRLISFLQRRTLSLQSLQKISRDVVRSSSFLAAYVGLFYYSVCLARTRLGPKLFSYKTVTPQMWDAGLCVLAGCLTCGWSILLEQKTRRSELALFAAARALSTLLPRVYDRKYQYRERFVFAASITIVMAAAKRPRYVRGAFGRLLKLVVIY